MQGTSCAKLECVRIHTYTESGICATIARGYNCARARASRRRCKRLRYVRLHLHMKTRKSRGLLASYSRRTGLGRMPDTGTSTGATPPSQGSGEGRISVAATEAAVQRALLLWPS